jgi:hypothetical protein
VVVVVVVVEVVVKVVEVVLVVVVVVVAALAASTAGAHRSWAATMTEAGRRRRSDIAVLSADGILRLWANHGLCHVPASWRIIGHSGIGEQLASIAIRLRSGH